MNYCTRCQSYYVTAGTCNCFAFQPPVYPNMLPVYPNVWPLIVPAQGYCPGCGMTPCQHTTTGCPPYVQPYTTITWTAGANTQGTPETATFEIKVNPLNEFHRFPDGSVIAIGRAKAGEAFSHTWVEH